jgi:hypothetical protein
LQPKFLFQLLLLIQKGGGKWPDETLATYIYYKVLTPSRESGIDKSGHSFTLKIFIPLYTGSSDLSGELFLCSSGK